MVSVSGSEEAKGLAVPEKCLGPFFGVRNLTGENQFPAYQGEKVAVVKHRQALGVSAEVIANNQHQAGVIFGGGPFGGEGKTSFCSQFTSYVYKTSGETGVYGYGPNTQNWYTTK